MDTIKELPKVLSDINVPFKISAGPGAGKTTWLVEHVKNVLENSDKLNKTQKVACITYTRIGADTVNKKIKNFTDTSRLDIGTIHSFLYRNVIKPFVYLIEEDSDKNKLFNIHELTGHVEHRPSYDRISSWVHRIGSRYSYLYDQKKSDKNGQTNLDKTRTILKNFEWQFSGNKLEGKLSKANFSDLRFPSTRLYEYKLSCWSKGVMHHEDVLFFTHFIFEKEPRVIELISNKFPYLFLDEFQDTNPLQTWIIKKISDQATVIGVIGDPAQSIFKFAGANRKDFIDFTLPKIVNFKKSQNYRSSKKIIDFLKQLRSDIEQVPEKNTIDGEQVVMLVGKGNSAIKYINSLEENDFSVLCRWNKDVNNINDKFKTTKRENLIDLLYLEDSDHKRPRFIHSLIKAYDFNKSGEYKESILELKKHLSGINLVGMEKRKIIIEMLNYIKDNHESPIVDIYNYLQPFLKKHSVSFTGLRKTKGDYKEIHKTKFIDLIPFLANESKFKNKIKTIHQAKGDEYNFVLLCLFDKTDKNGKITKKIETILKNYIFDSKKNITLDSDLGEETRLIYVACSRAKKKLFINVPTLSESDQLKVENLGIFVDRESTELCTL